MDNASPRSCPGTTLVQDSAAVEALGKSSPSHGPPAACYNPCLHARLACPVKPA